MYWTIQLFLVFFICTHSHNEQIMGGVICFIWAFEAINGLFKCKIALVSMETCEVGCYWNNKLKIAPTFSSSALKKALCN